MIEIEEKNSKVEKYRKELLKMGYELINITTLCELKLGCSGWCNDFNELDETCHHIQIWYRDEEVAVVGTKGGYVLNEDKYIFFDSGEGGDNDFIIFRKIRINNGGKDEE